jgi:tRNA (guanine-N7-)-methyltransferase
MIYKLSDFHFPDSAARLYPHNPQGQWQLEIGFGDGRFWAAHCALEADTNYLGVEISGSSLLKAQQKSKRVGQADSDHGVILTKMPADVLLRAVIPPHSLSRIYVNFPDPWPKAGHSENRLLRRSFFELAAGRLRLGGEIWFTTDHTEYFEFALEQARQTPFYQISQPEPPKAALQTKYAKKWESYGLEANHARFTVIAHPTTPQPWLEVFHSEEAHMPHAIIDLPSFVSDFEKTAFEKTVTRSGDTTIILLEVMRGVNRPMLHFLAHIEEAELTQEILIGLTLREEGGALVRLEKFGSPIITAGVKKAVGAVTDYLEGRGAKVLMRAY